MEVIIDGRTVTLERPVTILEAARLAGVDIPTLCWHPRVSVLGACRLCMVEVEGMNRMLAACTTRVSDRMSVRTDTPALRKVRQTMLELLLCRHPMDCPTCVKGGECELQALAYKWSAPENRFPENPGAYPERLVSPYIERDHKKCVLCRRCMRVCEEVRGRTVLGAMHRGYRKTVTTFYGQPHGSDFRDPYNCEFCGSCIDICPVGALNSRQHKFRARTWEGVRVPTVCPFCSVGCLLSLQVKEGELVQSRPRGGPNNQDQACYRGRFAVDHANSAERLHTALVRRDGALVPAGEAEAVAALAQRLRPETGAMALVSSSLTQEETGDLVRFMSELFPRGVLRAVCTMGLNAADLPIGIGQRPWGDLAGADLIVVAGQDFSPFSPVAGVRIRVARRASGAPLAVLDARDTLLGTEADFWARPAGAALPSVLAALGRLLRDEHADRLRQKPDAALDAVLDAVRPEEVEAAAGMEAGALRRLAALVAAAKTPLFVGHRGWYDPEGQVPRLLDELDRMLGGTEAKGILYLRTDCNSRGTAELVSATDPELDGEPEALLVVAADPLGTALPGSPFERWTRDARVLVVFDSFLTPTAQRADFVFPLRTFAEKGGTFVANNGLQQRLAAALPAPAGVPELRATLEAIAAGLGHEMAWEPPAERPELWRPPARPSAPGPFPAAGPGERWLVLRGTPLADHRVRVVPEADRLFSTPALEVHPHDLAALGLAAGGEARVSSGSAAITLPVRPDWRTPPGQLHLPVDPRDERLAAFALAALRGEGWARGCVRVTGIAPAPGRG
jgi:NADH dehydrogenase/NADH:ubiquinone oxidoreductase subunit G